MSCKETDCSGEVHAKGLCSKHYLADYRRRVGREYKSTATVRTRIRRSELPTNCTEPGCDKPHKAKGRCNAHYAKLSAKKHGLTLEQRDALLLKQGGGCAICKEPLAESAIRIDHDHTCCPGFRSCGKCVRGILCNGCNIGIGHLREDIGRFKAAIEYLSPKRIGTRSTGPALCQANPHDGD